MLNTIHANMEALPEYLEAIAGPKKSPVPIIEPIDNDSMVQKPRTLFNSAIMIKLAPFFKNNCLYFNVVKEK